jgi:hypothetical protein
VELRLLSSLLLVLMLLSIKNYEDAEGLLFIPNSIFPRSGNSKTALIQVLCPRQPRHLHCLKYLLLIL